jgi:hypothetical protein
MPISMIGGSAGGGLEGGGLFDGGGGAACRANARAIFLGGGAASGLGSGSVFGATGGGRRNTSSFTGCERLAVRAKPDIHA